MPLYHLTRNRLILGVGIRMIIKAFSITEIQNILSDIIDIEAGDITRFPILYRISGISVKNITIPVDCLPALTFSLVAYLVELYQLIYGEGISFTHVFIHWSYRFLPSQSPAELVACELRKNRD
jgi:hypothetical protein